MKEPVFKPLTLEDRPVFEKYFRQIQPEIAEFTFTNLFVWRHAGILEHCCLDGKPVIRFTRNNETHYLPPLGFPEPTAALDLLRDHAKREGIPFLMRKVPEEFLGHLEGTGLEASEDRDNFDYLYRTEDLAHLKGRKYDGKRGFVKKFTALYKYEYIPFLPELTDCCLKLAEDWIKRRNSQSKDLQDEYKAIQETIRNAEALGVKGAFIRVNERTVAFTFGEELNRNTFIIHFEKADAEFTGSYQAINQLFVQKEVLGKYEFINREQDVGVESIRKAKLSYQPVRLVKKYLVQEK